MNWARKKVLVTGGGGFIGSALVDRLLDLGADVGVVDKLFLPTQPNIAKQKIDRLWRIFTKHGIVVPSIQTLDLLTQKQDFEKLAKGFDTVFHLSAIFGGREFVNTRQVDSAKMLAIDQNVIDASYNAGVEAFHYASSACVYPDSLQVAGYALKEEDALSTGEGFRGADNLYGWAKLMGELQCKVYHEEKGLKTSVCRYLTVYGPGEFDNSHAISALIEKALDQQDPFEIWGDGQQERGFTYVDDIVNGSILASEKITVGIPINLGTDERYTIDRTAEIIFRVVGWKSTLIAHLRDKPEGPRSRALNISRARWLLDWEPKVELPEGIAKTVEWHKSLRVIA